MYTLLPFLIPALLLFVILSGLFSLFTFALDLCRKPRLEKEKGKGYKAILDILENGDDDISKKGSAFTASSAHLLSACRLWNNILKALAVLVTVIILLSLFPARDGINASIIVRLTLCAVLLALIITVICDAIPARLSRAKPEKIAAGIFPVVKFLSYLMFPFTWLAYKFSSFLKKNVQLEINDNSVSEKQLQDDLRSALIEGEKSGFVESKQRTMVEGVFYLGDRPVGAFMTHRSEIKCFDINDTCEDVRVKALESRQQQCFPVVRGTPDDIAGAVYLEDIILNYAQNETSSGTTLRAIMKKPQFVPETMSALKAFESFKQGQSNFLFVMDEYGGLAGIISVRALVEEIVGELSAPAANEDPPLLRQEDGSWLADGALKIDDAAGELGITGHDEESDFHTLAGLILHLAGELPKVGDSYEYQGYKFKVVDKDGNRIDKILITKQE